MLELRPRYFRCSHSGEHVKGSLNLDSDQLNLFIEKEETKQRLRADTQNSFERGVFGSPTVFVDGEMYWGTPEAFWYLDEPL